MGWSVMAQSSTVRDMGPAWSIDQIIGISPYGLTLLQVGRSPTTPHHDDGWRMDPDVSSPSDVAHSPAATAAPEPELEDPGS